MDTAQFTYNVRHSLRPATALGVETPWEQLREEFQYRGDGIAGASYYRTISKQGPELFAVVNEDWVYYYEHHEWHRYNTARDIQHGMIDLDGAMPRPATTEQEERNYHERVRPVQPPPPPPPPPILPKKNAFSFLFFLHDVFCVHCWFK